MENGPDITAVVNELSNTIGQLTVDNAIYKVTIAQLQKELADQHNATVAEHEATVPNKK